MRAMMESLSDHDYLEYLEYHYPEQRKEFTDGTNLVGTKLHDLTLNCGEGGTATEVCRMYSTCPKHAD